VKTALRRPAQAQSRTKPSRVHRGFVGSRKRSRCWKAAELWGRPHARSRRAWTCTRPESGRSCATAGCGSIEPAVTARSSKKGKGKTAPPKRATQQLLPPSW